MTRLSRRGIIASSVRRSAGAGIVFRAKTNLATGTRTTSTVPMPAGVQAGDLVLISIGVGGPSLVTVTPPGTVTLVSNVTDTAPDPWSVNTRIYSYKVIGSGDPSSFAFTHSSAVSDGAAVAYSGVDGATPIDVTPSTNAYVHGSGSATSATALGITTTVPNTMLVCVRSSWDGNPITPPAGWTERIDQPVTWVGEHLQAASGATGNFLIPHGNTGNADEWATILIALRPA